MTSHVCMLIQSSNYVNKIVSYSLSVLYMAAIEQYHPTTIASESVRGILKLSSWE